MALVTVLPVSALFALAIFICQRSVQPIYGAVPTQLHLFPVIAGFVAFGSFLPSVTLPRIAYPTALWLFISPRLAYHSSVLTTSLGDAVLGPVITNSVVIGPLAIASALCAKQLNVC